MRPVCASREETGTMKLSVSGMIVVMPALAVVILALAAPPFARPADLPVQGLESRIDFWKKVYTQYGEDNVIIHDRVHPNLIYDVASRGNQAERIAAVQQALDEIGENLARPEQLSVTAQQIRAAILASG